MATKTLGSNDVEEMRPYHYDYFYDLFHSEIAYAAEAQYPPDIYTDVKGIKYVSFYKLTLCETGIGSYKTSQFTFNTYMWPKIVKLAELLKTSKAEKVLYVKEK